MKYIIGIILVLALVGFGYVMGGTDARIERDEARGQYASALATATMDRDAANARANNIEKRWSSDIKEVGTTYEGIVKNEKAAADRTIADLRNDVVRLRVRTATLASGGALRGAAEGGAVDPGQAEQTLDGSVAARLAGRYADYNALVDQLNACQAVILIERAPQP